MGGGAGRGAGEKKERNADEEGPETPMAGWTEKYAEYCKQEYAETARVFVRVHMRVSASECGWYAWGVREVEVGWREG